MAGLIYFLLMSLVFIGMGWWHLSTPLDDQWKRRERLLLARGLAPQRNEVWEQSVQRSGWILIGMGVLIFLVTFIIAASIPPKMSGVSINGHELTQAEWDACGHNTVACINMRPELIRRRSP